jgi:hypothetical protein
MNPTLAAAGDNGLRSSDLEVENLPHTNGVNF